MKKNVFLTGFAALLLLALSCEKSPAPPPDPDPQFEFYIDNAFNILEARFDVFASDADGKIVAYRRLPGSDTAVLNIPGSTRDQRFDITVAKVVTIDAQGSGIKDTIINLTTYTDIGHGERLNLRNPNYSQTTDLKFIFTGIATFDSIVVPDGLTFSRPQIANNYYGHYRILHTGKLWFRFRINSEPNWRFIQFDNVTTPVLDLSTVGANLQQTIFAYPKKVTFPFSGAWEYKIDGLVDTAQLKFFPLSDQLRAPGGAIPVFGNVDVFEPIANDIFNPGPKPYTGFRFRAYGPQDPLQSNYGYYIDQYFAEIPSVLPVPTFDLNSTILAGNRQIAVQCSGDFDLLAFSRSRAGTPNINWEVLIKPQNGIVQYRLPDVPSELGKQFPSLKNYDFGGQVRARADHYKRLDGYKEAVKHRLLNLDPLWQAKYEYLGREETFN